MYIYEAMNEIYDTEQILKKKMNLSIEQWFEVACKLDYISLEDKISMSKLFSMIEKKSELNGGKRVSKSTVDELKDIMNFMCNTTFPSSLIEAAIR